ncbi:gamete and mating-type specific protein A-like, partial [Micropterus dolomieu]|uniref:gamete and mating-type specific protein A-like n=1 Tax=Micropterus dolomieu TaxID=147949 RepID=UPI001E8EBBDF
MKPVSQMPHSRTDVAASCPALAATEEDMDSLISLATTTPTPNTTNATTTPSPTTETTPTPTTEPTTTPAPTT